MILIRRNAVIFLLLGIISLINGDNVSENQYDKHIRIGSDFHANKELPQNYQHELEDATDQTSEGVPIRDEDDGDFNLQHRLKRQTTSGGVDIQPGNPPSVVVNGQHSWPAGRGDLTAQGHFSQPLGSGKPSYGGGIGYNDNIGGAGIDVTRHPYGTNVGAQGNYDVWRSGNGNTRLGIEGRYDRNFGGPFGTGRPNYYGGLNFQHRFKRQTTTGGVDIQPGNPPSVVVNGQHSWPAGRGDLTAQGHFSQPLGSGKPSYGGGIGYNDNRGGAGIDVTRHPYGTNVGAQGNYDVWRSGNGNTRLGVEGRYDRNFGGPFGTGRPNYYGGLNFQHRFKRQTSPGDVYN